MTAAAPTAASVAARLRSAKGPHPNGWRTAFCPFHDDRKTPSLRFTEDGFKCMGCGEHGNLSRLAECIGLDVGQPVGAVERLYDYCDEHGKLLFQVVRRPGKRFSQRRPDGQGGWIWDLKGVRRVMYRLPEVLAAAPDRALFLVEGEKDADRLWAEGIPATTNPMGADNWRPAYAESLRGRRVVVVPDNDDAGRRHAEVARRSLDGVAADVRILSLSGLPEKGDVSDWLDAGQSAEKLLALAEAAELFRPGDGAQRIDDFPRTDAGNGELFARLYGDRVRYDHRRRRWLTWGGHWWTEDADGEVRRLAKLAARHRYVSAPEAEDDLQARTAVAKFAIQSENRQRLDAMLSQAQTERPVSDAGTSWNADPWLLGVGNGVVDLRTGQLRPGRHDDHVTFHVSVGYDPNARCPRWLRFLDEVFRSDTEVIDFIQRAVGYSLTGITTEQCMFLCYGRGANGKTVLLAVLRALSGDYAYNAPFSLFEIHSRSAIPNDLAALVGSRLVTSSETNEGTRLNEARVKALTGCDPITARFLHGEFFTFDPVGKYWLAVNHKPTVQDDSYGFWRRVRLIPFTREFSNDEADDGLTAALMAELPGILAWAVQGALTWRREGLGEAAAVRSATESYRVESDPLAQFLDECCVLGDDFLLPGSQAFKTYKAWGMGQGMGDRELLSSKTFGGRMAMKFERKHSNRGNAYVGVGLRPESEG
ncbi:MAG: phage/plasmid primase, P4 family [Dehalococcoidia bacterium]